MTLNFWLTEYIYVYDQQRNIYAQLFSNILIVLERKMGMWKVYTLTDERR